MSKQKPRSVEFLACILVIASIFIYTVCSILAILREHALIYFKNGDAANCIVLDVVIISLSFILILISLKGKKKHAIITQLTVTAFFMGHLFFSFVLSSTAYGTYLMIALYTAMLAVYLGLKIGRRYAQPTRVRVRGSWWQDLRLRRQVKTALQQKGAPSVKPSQSPYRPTSVSSSAKMPPLPMFSHTPYPIRLRIPASAPPSRPLTRRASIPEVLDEFGSVKDDVLMALSFARCRVKGGVSVEWLETIIASACATAIRREDPTMTEESIEEKSQQLANEIIKRLDQASLITSNPNIQDAVASNNAILPRYRAHVTEAELAGDDS